MAERGVHVDSTLTELRAAYGRQVQISLPK
jgi:hypothetical protein